MNGLEMVTKDHIFPVSFYGRTMGYQMKLTDNTNGDHILNLCLEQEVELNFQLSFFLELSEIAAQKYKIPNTSQDGENTDSILRFKERLDKSSD